MVGDLGAGLDRVIVQASVGYKVNSAVFKGWCSLKCIYLYQITACTSASECTAGFLLPESLIWKHFQSNSVCVELELSLVSTGCLQCSVLNVGLKLQPLLWCVIRVCTRGCQSASKLWRKGLLIEMTCQKDAMIAHSWCGSSTYSLSHPIHPCVCFSL